ncbi:PREDICTED: leucine-rich repeat protein 1 [Ceratosolen solmsi marchali]|uniref:Leucine-rich repeat protein 1 n=1 Tax=Ceratosolen solmsi marchali TaxID=326594 RepID=A0AAJ7DYF0_9HYME|nr:PREDICTED: leucine-rich repeat protein 1 [Ceratosolen solmsi marchali]
MKLICNVDVYNRLSSLAINIRQRKPQKSCLIIGKQSKENDEVYLILQTKSNKIGVKYKINNNIKKIFTKFVDEGKASFRIIEPSHDINIQCDPIQLKSFLHVLKLILLKKFTSPLSTLSDYNKKSINIVPKTKIIISKVLDYPTLKGFPKITEQLYLCGLQRKSFDCQILKLHNLKILNLSQNQLTNLPQELGMLPNLQELSLSDNQFGKCPISKWSWMNGSNITKTLRSLNLSCNKLTKIPDEISKLHALLSLNINNNLISSLPEGIGNLKKLKYLNISKNNITNLPGSMTNLRLYELDISENSFQINNDNTISVCDIKISCLVDLAAQVVIKTRIYYDASIIPFTLIQYLDKAHYCMCGVPCFNSFMRKFMPMNLSTITNSIRFSGISGNNILFDCYFCSFKCLRRYFLCV